MERTPSKIFQPGNSRLHRAQLHSKYPLSARFGRPARPRMDPEPHLPAGLDPRRLPFLLHSGFPSGLFPNRDWAAVGGITDLMDVRYSILPKICSAKHSAAALIPGWAVGRTAVQLKKVSSWLSRSDLAPADLRTNAPPDAFPISQHRPFGRGDVRRVC